MIVMTVLFKSFLVDFVYLRFYLKTFFFLMGTIPSTKNAWAPKTPSFFPLMGTVPSTAGHLDPAPPSKFCPSP